MKKEYIVRKTARKLLKSMGMLTSIPIDLNHILVQLSSKEVQIRALPKNNLWGNARIEITCGQPSEILLAIDPQKSGEPNSEYWRATLAMTIGFLVLNKELKNGGIQTIDLMFNKDNLYEVFAKELLCPKPLIAYLCEDLIRDLKRGQRIRHKLHQFAQLLMAPQEFIESQIISCVKQPRGG